MHDIRAIRDDPAAFDQGWASRGLPPEADTILALDASLRAVQTGLQYAQNRRNEASKLVGMAKARNDEATFNELVAEVEQLKAVIAKESELERTKSLELRELLAGLPNIPAPDVPVGEDEAANVEDHRWGEPFAIADPKDHVDLGAALGQMDFETAARMSGARFVVLRGELARLERALGQFMLDIQTREHGYQEVSPPLLVREAAAFGTGQLPKFEQDLFQTLSVDPDLAQTVAHESYEREDNPRLLDLFTSQLAEIVSRRLAVEQQSTEIAALFDRLNRETAVAYQRHYKRALAEGRAASVHWLIPTAEVSLTNLVREQITPEEELPLRLTALTPCFRSEAGASGKDTRGMIRQHQFYKVELV
ncbi:MAG TPA: aminoacyl--tRNA ligase-related protein, partial [Caulobacteraceae bacterium]|nr:aminoacyl--tRNA ligase-related protein [Caulobacteraceae bacterium]